MSWITGTSSLSGTVFFDLAGRYTSGGNRTGIHSGTTPMTGYLFHGRTSSSMTTNSERCARELLIGPTSSHRRGIETRMAHARIAFGCRTRAISLISSRCASSNECAAMRASSLLVDNSIHSQCRNHSRLSARWERSCQVPETSSPLAPYMTWLHLHRKRLTSDLEALRRQSEDRYAYRRHRLQELQAFVFSDLNRLHSRAVT